MVVLQLHIPLAVYPLTLKRSLDLFATRQEGSDASKSKGRVEDIRELSAFAVSGMIDHHYLYVCVWHFRPCIACMHALTRMHVNACFLFAPQRSTAPARPASSLI